MRHSEILRCELATRLRHPDQLTLALIRRASIRALVRKGTANAQY